MSNVPVTPEVVLYQGIRDILLAARMQLRQTVHTTMVQAYWQIGRLIVAEEQGGERRAEFGKRYSASNLWNYRHFYLAFPIGHTACDQFCLGRLSWSHFRKLLRVQKLRHVGLNP